MHDISPPDINECASKTHGCYGSCLNTEGSYTCLCPDGLQLSIADNRSCTGIRISCVHFIVIIFFPDINECSTGGHNCSHNCHNTNGSYVCSCPPGSLLSNGRDCSIDVQLTAASGSISLNRSDSKWRIIIPDTNKVINLNFQSLSISCSSGGLVEVFNGLNPLSSVSLLRTCGTTVPSPIISSINELSLEYKTGGVNDSASLKYETVTSPTSNEPVINTQMLYMMQLHTSICYMWYNTAHFLPLYLSGNFAFFAQNSKFIPILRIYSIPLP